MIFINKRNYIKLNNRKANKIHNFYNKNKKKYIYSFEKHKNKKMQKNIEHKYGDKLKKKLTFITKKIENKFEKNIQKKQLIIDILKLVVVLFLILTTINILFSLIF